MRRLLSLLLVVAIATPIAAQPGFAIPKEDGWVTDDADLLTPAQENELETLMESYRRGSSHEVALLTIEKLPEVDIERFALETGRQWGLGRKGENDGALLVVAHGDRKVRIEVGRGLEGTVTDSISGRIIREVITPEFKAGRFFEGIRSGIQAIHAAAGGRYADIPDRRTTRTVRGQGCWLFGLMVGFMLLFVLAARGGGDGGRRGRRGSIWPWIIAGSVLGSGRRHSTGGGFGRGFGGGSFGGFGGGGGFSGGGATGSW